MLEDITTYLLNPEHRFIAGIVAIVVIGILFRFVKKFVMFIIVGIIVLAIIFFGLQFLFQAS